MNHAEQVANQFTFNTNKKITLQKLADKFPHTVTQGVGTKTYNFHDGSLLQARGRGRYFRLTVAPFGGDKQAA